MEEKELIQLHADQIRANRWFDRSGPLQRLFDFLLTCSLEGRAPKEIEIAIDAFGKDPSFDVTQDAHVRVYVHKLRRRLDEFYSGPGAQLPERLVVPRGEYRLAIQRPVAAPAATPHRWRPPRWAVASVVGVVALAGLLLGAYRIGTERADTDIDAVRDSSVWVPLLDDDRPVYIVVGDYYIFGERNDHDANSSVERLVRDFSINSRDDLSSHLVQHPETASRYVDLNLAYLPIGSAFAVRDIMPVLARKNRRVRVALASSLDPEVFKSAHVIYIGYLSGLGMLSDFVFAGSRFSIGQSYDELIDLQTGEPYLSEAGTLSGNTGSYRDYGYFSTFGGPNGVQHLIIAGNRDTALMQVAEMLTDPARLRELTSRAKGAGAFEALYEVLGVEGKNIQGKLLLASPLNPTDFPHDNEAERPAVRAAQAK